MNVGIETALHRFITPAAITATTTTTDSAMINNCLSNHNKISLFINNTLEALYHCLQIRNVSS